MFNNSTYPNLNKVEISQTDLGRVEISQHTSDAQRALDRRGDARPAARADRPLSTAHIRPRVVYNSGSSLLKSTKGQDCEQAGGGRRGSVKGFSRQSRRRLMVLIASIRRDAELPYFVTLTYPGEFPTCARSKRDIKVFLQRLARKYPGCGFIWKLEPQQRGAPHFHLLVWGAERDLLIWVSRNWYEIAGNGDKNHYLFHLGLLRDSRPCVEKVRSFRGVWAYASKYLGKTFEVAEWGNVWTGRFWGVGNRQNIPFGDEIEIPLELSQVIQLMRFQRRFAHFRRGSGNSLTIFCDAEQWVLNMRRGLV